MRLKADKCQMTKFAPKGEDVIRQEVYEDLNLDHEASDEDKARAENVVQRRLKDEQFKASLHKDKKNHLNGKEFYKQKMIEAGIDPKTGKSVNQPKRDNQPNGEFVTKDDLKDFGQRQRYSHLSDEEYASINALAKSSGKSFEETLEKNPVVAAYMQTVDVSKRLAGATKAPGTRFMPGEQKTEDDKVSEELSGDLPNGFKLSKSK